MRSSPIPISAKTRCGRRAASANVSDKNCVAVRIIRKSPDRLAEFGESRAALPTVGIDIRRSLSATITEGDLIVIGAETYRIIGEPLGDALGLVSACEAVKL
ncbi:head-tail joining protein [Candidatus Raskinella chloraquaticus]|uniref:head-tail joining protein n=1 Tax=Candidatus Raskinella chloraquaticus TaxID=1951219 RepID=UPI0026A946D8